LETVEDFFHNTGFAFTIRVLDRRDGDGWGAMLRRGVAEAKESIVVVIDPELPYGAAAIGHALAVIGSGATEIVYGSAVPAPWLLRKLLADLLPDPRVHLAAFSWDAARLLFAESKLLGGGCALEIAYLANKYGFRIEHLHVDAEPSPRRAWGGFRALRDVAAIRLHDRRNGYRAARRCPICFSSEVWTWAQIPGNLVRACSRCKCRYLNQFAEEGEGIPVRREILPNPAPSDPFDETAHSRTARDKTNQRRIVSLRKHVPARARVLEVGVRDGGFGALAAREYEYVGIDRAVAAARAARARGLEVYCSTVTNFVNTGPAFDAVTLYRVFENMAEPHDALAHVKELIKPGGLLLLTAFDTEGLLYLLTERRHMAHNFRAHLILYSRSALIELLEHSGFEIVSVAPAVEYRDHKFLRHRLSRHRLVAAVTLPLLKFLPDPLPVSSGSIRVVARRRGGARIDVRAIRSIEPTHAR
ncbi:MAG TPA: class I SAM-dependent methyltransferase, partial [Thermoanaerobaculia bacterium]|nr:class I SAM-dependent methyltransferase [Thermoanaerobaculia bacterium]